MGKKDRMGRRRMTDEDIARIADTTGMTCDPEVCCPDRKRKPPKRTGEKKPGGDKPDKDQKRNTKDLKPGLTPTGAILDLLDIEEQT